MTTNHQIETEIKTSKDGKTKTTIVRIDGVEFKRKSPRTYLFAIVARFDYDAAVARVEAARKSPSETDRSDFEYRLSIAEGRDPYPQPLECDQKLRVARAKEEVAGGFEAYINRKADLALAGIENGVSDGDFKLGVVAWSQSRASAEKTAQTYRTGHYNAGKWSEVGVVEIK